MLKKVVSFCLVFCMVFALVVPGYAQEKETSISSETVITEDNISEVLEYLGIDPNNFIKTDVAGTSARTVGDLEKAIKQAKKLPSEVNGKVKSKGFNGTADKSVASAASSGTVMLYATVNVGDSYTVEYEVAGQYADGKWTGASSATATVDSNFILYTYKIASKELKLSYTSSTITLKAKVVVDIYVGVGDYGLVKIGSQTINSTVNWYASTDIPE